MAEPIDIHDATANLFELLERVVRGEEIVIRRGGTPVARLVPHARRGRVLGTFAGRIRIREDFDALPPDLADAFGVGR